MSKLVKTLTVPYSCVPFCLHFRQRTLFLHKKIRFFIKKKPAHCIINVITSSKGGTWVIPVFKSATLSNNHLKYKDTQQFYFKFIYYSGLSKKYFTKAHSLYYSVFFCIMIWFVFLRSSCFVYKIFMQEKYYPQILQTLFKPHAYSTYHLIWTSWTHQVHNIRKLLNNSSGL